MVTYVLLDYDHFSIVSGSAPHHHCVDSGRQIRDLKLVSS
jgi:hypothetical protein